MISTAPSAPDIRAATRTDVPVIQQVARRSLSQSCSFLDESARDHLVEEKYDDDALRAAIERPDVTYVVACASDEDEEDAAGALVGYASAVQTTATEGAVPSLAVAPERWGEGIGTALVERLIATLHRRGVERVEMSVLAGNEVAIDFCEARGFECVDERETELPSGPHREFVYTSDLSDGAKP
jgi:ribosomal protein S18 acetylase RimI-like enzyme